MMTKEEIIDMANQSGMIPLENAVNALGKSVPLDWLINFAKLVAEKEREKFCAVLRQLHDSYSLTSDSNAIRARGQE